MLFIIEKERVGKIFLLMIFSTLNILFSNLLYLVSGSVSVKTLETYNEQQNLMIYMNRFQDEKL